MKHLSMILFKFKKKPHPSVIGITLKHYRWVVEAHTWFKAAGISLTKQISYTNESGKWWDTTYMSVSLNRHFHWGMNHSYYDGPHCCLSLGLIHISWNVNANCTKCLINK